MCVEHVINQRTVSINVITAVARGLRGLWAKHPKRLKLGVTSIVHHNESSKGVRHYARWKSADVEATGKGCCMWYMMPETRVRVYPSVGVFVLVVLIVHVKSG